MPHLGLTPASPVGIIHAPSASGLARPCRASPCTVKGRSGQERAGNVTCLPGRLSPAPRALGDRRCPRAAPRTGPDGTAEPGGDERQGMVTLSPPGRRGTGETRRAPKAPRVAPPCPPCPPCPAPRSLRSRCSPSRAVQFGSAPHSDPLLVRATSRGHRGSPRHCPRPQPRSHRVPFPSTALRLEAAPGAGAAAIAIHSQLKIALPGKGRTPTPTPAPPEPVPGWAVGADVPQQHRARRDPASPEPRESPEGQQQPPPPAPAAVAAEVTHVTAKNTRGGGTGASPGERRWHRGALLFLGLRSGWHTCGTLALAGAHLCAPKKWGSCSGWV